MITEEQRVVEVPEVHLSRCYSLLTHTGRTMLILGVALTALSAWGLGSELLHGSAYLQGTGDSAFPGWTSIILMHPVFAVLWMAAWLLCAMAGWGLLQRREWARRTAVAVLYIDIYWCLFMAGLAGPVMVLQRGADLSVATHSDFLIAAAAAFLTAVGVAYILYRTVLWMKGPIVREACRI